LHHHVFIRSCAMWMYPSRLRLVRVYCRVRVATTSPCSRTVTRKARHRKRFHFFCCGTTDKYFAAGGARWTGLSPQTWDPPRRQQLLWSTKTRASHGAASHVDGARDKVRIENRTASGSDARIVRRVRGIRSDRPHVAHGSCAVSDWVRITVRMVTSHQQQKL
jgi:hypothetical protein